MTERLTYVVSRWGAPTQTFVRREAAAVAALGVEVDVLSLKRPRRVPEAAYPVAHVGVLSTVVAAATIVLQHPGRAARIVGPILRHSAPRNLPRQLLAALTGIVFAHRRGAQAHPLHAHFGWVAATAAWAASRWQGAELSVVLHAFELHTERYVDGFTPVPLRDAARVFVISERDRAIVAERWGVDADVLRMGVPASWLQGLPEAGAPGRFVAVGSLVEKKGHDVLLQAMAQCPDHFRLEIIGDGPLREALLDQRTALGLGGRVELVGALPEAQVRERLARAGACVLACVEARDGDRDGIPVALMEAMALGVPVVTTTTGAIPELVAGAGLLVPPRDPGALAAAMVEVTDGGTHDRLAARGRARIREGWTSEAAARQLVRPLAAHRG